MTYGLLYCIFWRMNRTFKNAVIISTAIHFAIITPLYSVDISRDIPDQQKPMTVDYLVMDEIAKIEPPKISPDIRPDESREIKLSSNTGLEPTASTKKPKQEPAKKRKAAKVPPKDAAKSNPESRTAAAQEAQIKSTKDYIDYYQLIRENIRRKLKENYKYYYEEGDVHLAFILRSDGTLLSYAVAQAKSTPDENLRHIATVSLIEAAPFGPFPKTINIAKMSFSLVVSFKR